MLAVRKQDPTFVNYVPRTACEAVERFLRCKRNGLKPFLVPECLIECAKGLQGEELDMFENWMINPVGSEVAHADLCDLGAMRDEENRKFQETAARIEAELAGAPQVPEIPDSSDDEKLQPATPAPAPSVAAPSVAEPAACSGDPAGSAPTSSTGPTTPS